MPPTTRARKIADNIWVILANRLSMLLILPLAYVGWLYIDGRFDAIDVQAKAAQAEASTASDAVELVGNRVTAIETTISAGRVRRDEQYLMLISLIRDQSEQIAEQGRTQTVMLQAIAGLQATVNSIARSPGTPGPPPVGLAPQ